MTLADHAIAHLRDQGRRWREKEARIDIRVIYEEWPAEGAAKLLYEDHRPADLLAALRTVSGEEEFGADPGRTWIEGVTEAVEDLICGGADAMKGYVVRFWQYHQEGRHFERDGRERTIVLRGIHPLAWCSLPPAIYRAHFFAVVVGWQEFDCPDHLWTAINEGAVLSAEDYSSRAYTEGDDEIDDLPPELRPAERLRRRLLANYLTAERASEEEKP